MNNFRTLNEKLKQPELKIFSIYTIVLYYIAF